MSNRGLAGSREPKGSDEIVSQTLRVTKELRIDLAAGVEELEAGPKGPRWETHIPTQPPISSCNYCQHDLYQEPTIGFEAGKLGPERVCHF